MNKKLLVFAGLLSYVLSFAQFSENFNAGIPGTMTQTFQTGTTAWGACGTSLGGAVCPINGSGSATFFQANYNASLSSLESPNMNLSSGSYRLTFKHVQRSWGGDINVLNVQISLNGGTTWTTMVSYNQEVFTTTDQSIILNNFGPLTANTKIRLQASNSYGYRTIIDDVAVTAISGNDLQLTNFLLNDITPAGQVSITGAVFNNGLATVNTLVVNYQVNGGAQVSHTINGLSIATGQSATFTHAIPWNATVGSYAIVTSVSTPNFTDSNLNNNSLTKNTAVPSNSTLKKPLLEKFTASTCGPCATFNNNTFNNFYTNNNADFSLIAYHVNFPGAGDPYFIQDATTRRNVYSVSGVPDLVINALNVSPGAIPSTTQLNTSYTAAKLEPGYFVLAATHNIVGTTIAGNLAVTPYLTGQYRFFIAVIEKQTLNNTGSNGETSFKHVMMAMLPDAQGTTVNTVANTGFSIPFNVNMAGTFVEEMTDLRIVVFVQPINLKNVYQSAYSTETTLATTTTEKISSVKLYPNPSKGFVTVETKNAVTITVIDLLGKTVFAKNNLENQSSVDLSNLSKGIYMVKLESEKATSTQKLVLE